MKAHRTPEVPGLLRPGVFTKQAPVPEEGLGVRITVVGSRPRKGSEKLGESGKLSGTTSGGLRTEVGSGTTTGFLRLPINKGLVTAQSTEGLSIFKECFLITL